LFYTNLIVNNIINPSSKIFKLYHLYIYPLKLNVVLPSQNFRGMSYGEWASVWSQWLVSEDPTYNGEDILFLRGNVNYRPIGNKKDGPQYLDPNAIYDKSGNNGETIFENTAILIPILTSDYSLGDFYNGRKITTIPDLRYIANKDTDGGSIWARIMKPGEKNQSIVPNLLDYRFESPLYLLSVPKNSKLRKKMDAPPKIGNYYAITVGYFIIIKTLSIGTYRLLFGGSNGNAYHTNAVVDIKVIKGKRDKIVDKSKYIK